MVGSIFTVLVVLFLLTVLAKMVVVVPQQEEYVVERLGRYSRTLTAGLHFLIPFFDRISSKMTRQEIPMDTAAQSVITGDNVTVTLDGILYYQVVDSFKATYGVSNYEFAIESLTKTTLRSECGKYSLDQLLEARDRINAAVVAVLDQASESWGVKVLRFEIKDIVPPAEILEAMQRQMRAERDRRERVTMSEGKRTEAINIAEGERAARIARSEGERQEVINRAEGERIRLEQEALGQQAAIKAVAQATADAIKMVGAACAEPGGAEAMKLDIAKRSLEAFASVANNAKTTLVIPDNMSSLANLMAGAQAVMNAGDKPADK